MKVKTELMEYLVRRCVQEVLSQVYETSDKGALAPPADGQGTADQPAIPKRKDTRPEPPSGKETPPFAVNEDMLKLIRQLVDKKLNTI
jgi:hypothetical protein